VPIGITRPKVHTRSWTLARTAIKLMDSAIAKTGRTFLFWTAALVLLFGQAGSALAQTPSQVIYGPASVKLPSTSLFSFSGSFTASASVTGPYLLRVQLSAANSLTSLSFRLNSVQVLSLADFSGGKTQVDRTVTVLTNNTYSLQVAGKTGTVITVTVFATPNLPKPVSLTPNPLSVTVGASGTLTTMLSPTPTAAGTLSVSSANTAVATVPASVSFASGQTSVAIPVTARAAGSAVITASANGGSASATVNVTPAPPTITSLAPGLLTVVQGASGNLTVTISAAQTADAQALLASSNANIASVASSVSVPAGQVSAAIPVAGVAPGNAQITASLNGSSASSQITVNAAAPTVVSLVPVTATVTLGASTTLTLTISAAQASATVVPLAASPAGIVTVPASVTVPAGSTSVPLSVGTVALGQAGISASLNGSSASSVVNVVPPAAQVVSLEPATFTMNVGATSSFTVTINAAQLANTAIALAVDTPLVLQIPASVTVALGQTSTVFTATGLAVGNAVITASVNGTQKTSAVHVSPQQAAIVSLLPNPLPLQQGATGSLTVTLNVAQEADTLIALANDAPAIAQVPASITVPAGSLSAPIPVNALASGTANITASVNNASAVTLVQVTPPPPVVSTLTPAALTLPKGTPGTLRVTVSRAPNVATAVTLASSDPNIASVPPTVNIPAGALFADLPVASNAVGQATITASLNGGSATATVTITAAELTTLTLSPQTPTIYTSETVPLSATGTMTDGTSQDFTTRVTWTSSSTAVATINAAGLASALAAGTTTIGASFSFTTAIDGSSQTVSASAVLTVKQQVALVLTAPTTTLTVGSGATVTVTSSDPAPAAGLTITLTQNGSGSATFPLAVQIAANGTSTTFTLNAGTAGSVIIVATAFERLPGSIAFSIQLVPPVLPTVSVSVTSPVSGAVVASDTVTVSGTLQGPVNTGVTVNGVTAIVTGNTFIAANVPLQTGANSLMVTATGPNGQTATQTVSVMSIGPAPIQVTASPTQGVAPLAVTFTINNRTGNTVQSVFVDLTGSGNFLNFGAITTVSNNYIAGTYQVGFIINDSSGARYEQTVTVVAQDPAQIDQTLRAAWSGFTSALASQDTAQALQYFNAQGQVKYGPAVTTLLPQMPQIVGTFSQPQLLSVTGGVGEYAVNRIIDGVNRLFLIYFVQDVDGVWRIDSM
jgi:hypothetical protein